MRIIKSLTAIVAAAAIILTLTFGAMGTEPVIGSDVAAFASQHNGCKYQYASKGPEKFDCSGFVHYVLGNFGITFGNSTSEYNSADEAAAFGTVINSMADAKEGEIIVWSSHAAVYLGDGECISAMNAKWGVCIREVEDFVDKNGNKNPSHFFIRPFGYADDASEEAVEENTESSKSQHLSFKERIEKRNREIVEFFKKLFMPVTVLFS